MSYFPYYRAVYPPYNYGNPMTPTTADGTAGYNMPAQMPSQMPGQLVPAGYPGAGMYESVPVPAGGPVTGAVGDEQSYIENILRFNKGKIATFHLTYENNTEWNAQVLRGRIETAGRDHLIISDPRSGRRYLLKMTNLDWVEFDEPVTYVQPSISPTVQNQLTTG